ncbi:hypothetical protein NKH18_49250 [Streptomyces sp. M10(2022)]
MRTLGTDAERDEAVALVQDRQRWLTMRGLSVPARADIPALFRDSQAHPAGLFEDGLLLACMIPQRTPDLGWGQGPFLFLSCVHTLPDRSDDTVQLITLWASDFAARLDLPLVRAEALARHPSTLIRSPHYFVGSPTWVGTCADRVLDSMRSASPASNSSPSSVLD